MALVGLLGVVSGMSVLVAEPAAAVSCPSASGDRLAVVVVVDPGEGSPQQRCVVVPARSNGLDALRAAYPSPPVRIEGAGFVCAIGGLPDIGCAMNGAGGQPYWRYWHRSGGQWEYSSVGAGFYRLQAPADGSRCVVEGWSYGISTSGSAATAPGVAAGSVSCQFPAPPTTSRPAPAAPAGPPASSPVGGGGASTGSGATPTSPDPVQGSGDVSDGRPAGDVVPGGSDETESAATLDAAESEASGSDAETSDAGDAAGAGSEDRGDDPNGVEGAAAVSVAEDGGGGAPWAGVALTVALVAGLGVVAVRRSRERGGSTGGP